MMTCILLLIAGAVAADDATKDQADAWKVDDAHGPTHTVHLDLTEGTWLNVTVHGDRIVFDLLGDLWSMPLAGGDATRLTQGAAWDGQPSFSPDGSKIAFVTDRGGNENVWVMNADGTDAHALTEEAVARVTHPTWDPTGQWIVARRRTVDTRSIGVTELWQWHVDGGKGFALTSKDEHPHAGEPTLNDRYVWFSTRAGRFEYNGNPVAGLWEVDRLDRETGEIRTAVHGPGSAARPMLTPDGQRLIVISRDRTRTLLESVELATGRRTVIGDFLSQDNMEAFALHGTYPRMDWTPGGQLVLWAQGKLWRVDVSTGVRVEIPFHVVGDWTLHDVSRTPIAVADAQMAKVIRWPTWSALGAVAFSALNRVYVRTGDGRLTRVGDGSGFAPAWSRSGEDLVYTSWSDADGGRLHLVRGRGKPEVLPVRGQLVNPAFDESGDRIVVLRGGGGGSTPDLGGEPWYEIVLLERNKKTWTSRVVTTVHNRGSASRAPRLHLHDDRIWWMDDRAEAPRTPATAYLVSVDLLGHDKRDHLVLGGAEEVAISPDFRNVAYKVGHQLHVARMPPPGTTVSVSDGAVPDHQVTKIVGDWIGWSADGAEVTWVQGNVFKSLPIAALFARKDADDKPAEGEKEKVDPLADPEGTVSTTIEVPFDRARPQGVIALTHARVITMETDDAKAAVIPDTTVVIERDRILRIGGDVPAGAKVIDCTGKTVIPGLIDVHAHLHYSSADILPEQEWRYLTALDFGVTTVQDPSASTDLVFTQAERVEAGLMRGPRVYSTGGVLYGALSNDGAETPDRDAARAHVQRMVAAGARSVKVYQQSQRERRQWYVQACNEAGILCVPEGGGDLWMDLGMVADGFHAIEHSLPMAPLYADVLGFFGGSHTKDSWGTAYTQTLLVAYGGLSGENWFLQHANPVDDARLLRHFPQRLLDAYAWRPSTMAQDGDWRHMDVARSGEALRARGTLVTLGAHGQLQGLGVHWELHALAGDGAMSAYDALRAGTIQGARYMGLEAELGSVSAGKLADLVVLDSDPLADIRNSTDIAFVVKNGVVFE